MYFSQFRKLESEITVPAWPGSGENPHPSLHTAAFLLWPRMAESELALWPALMTLMTSSILVTSQRPYLQTHHIAIGVQHMNGGHTHSVHCTGVTFLITLSVEPHVPQL